MDISFKPTADNPGILPGRINDLQDRLLADRAGLSSDIQMLERLARWRFARWQSPGKGIGGPAYFIGLMMDAQPWMFLSLEPDAEHLTLSAVPIDTADELAKAWRGMTSSGEIAERAGAGFRIAFAREGVEIEALADLADVGIPESCLMANPIARLPFSMKELGEQDKILYRHLDPLVFVAADITGANHLFYCYEDPEHGVLAYVGAPIEAADLQALLDGRMTMIEPFRRVEWLWEAIWPGTGEHYLGRPVPSDGCPLIPPQGVTLYPQRSETESTLVDSAPSA